MLYEATKADFSGCGPASREWHDLHEENLKRGMSASESVAKIDKRHPGLRERMIEEANEGQ